MGLLKKMSRIEAAASYVLGANKVKLYHRLYQGDKERESKIPVLGELVAEVYYIQQRKKAHAEIKACTELFDVRGATYELTKLGKEIAALCEEYGLWDREPFKRATPSEAYLAMFLHLQTEFSMKDLEALGGAWGTLCGWEDKNWIKKVKGGTFRFTELGIAYKTVIATLWAGIDTSKRDHHLAMADALAQAHDGIEPIPSIKEGESELERLEAELEECEKTIGQYELRRAELKARIAEIRAEEADRAQQEEDAAAREEFEALTAERDRLMEDRDALLLRLDELQRQRAEYRGLVQQKESMERELREKEERLIAWADTWTNSGISSLSREFKALDVEICRIEPAQREAKERAARVLEKIRSVQGRLAKLVTTWKAGRKGVPKEIQLKVDIAIFGHPLDENAEWKFHHIRTAYERFEHERKRFFRAAELMLTGLPEERKVLDALSSDRHNSLLFRVASLKDCIDTGIHDPGDERQLAQEGGQQGESKGEPRYIPTFWAIGLMVLYHNKTLTKEQVLTILSDPTLKGLKRAVAPEMMSIKKALYEKPFRLPVYASWKKLMYPKPVGGK